MASEAQAGAFLATRGDIRGLICSNRPEICQQGSLAIVTHWFNQVLTGGPSADWTRKQQAGGNLDRFLGGGSAAPGGLPTSTTGGDFIDQIAAAIGVSRQIVMYGGGGLVLLMLLSKKR